MAIETSCDETAAAVIQNGKIKSNVIASQAQLHNQYGGVVPEVAAREHVPAIIPTIDLALKKAKTSLSKIDVIAVTQGPGLMTSLMVGIDAAKALGLALGKPVVPVNHLEAHIYANFASVNNPSQPPLILKGGMTAATPPLKIRRGRGKSFPALILIVSGGHTMLVLMKNHGQLKIVGETVDDAAGEAFDKSAKLLGLGYPGGPLLSRRAKNGNPERFNFPRPMINSKDLNFSFSGLKTAVLYEVQKHRIINPELKADIAASVQKAIVDVLIAKTEKAIEKYRPKTIVLGGGVAANELLRERYKLLAKSCKLSCSIPPLALSTDNAAMIGLAAYYRIKTRQIRPNFLFEPQPNLQLA